MSKLVLADRVPYKYTKESIVDLILAIQNQVNALSEGRISGRYQAAPASPSSGNYAKGDIVWNSDVTTGGHIGWVCIVSGSPGSWTTFGAVS